MKSSAASTRKATRIPAGFIASLSRQLALATLAALGLGQSEAANFTWDPTLNAGVTGGAGTWDLTTANWYDGATDVVWPNLADSVAIFGGTGGVVTIDTAADSGVVANGLNFGVTGYRIAGASAGEVLTLAGTAPTITVSGANDAEIQTIVAGSAGLTKAGTGRLVLSGANIFTGGVSLLGGTVSVAADNNLGAAANGVLIDGGTLNTSGTFSTARVLTLGAAGGTISTDASSTVTVSTGIAANANGLTKTGLGTLILGAASTRTGVTSISGGTLSVTNVGALGTGAVSVTGAGNVYEINTGAATSVHGITVNDGATLRWAQNAQLTVGAGQPISFTGTGGTLFVGGTLASGKVLVGTGLLNSAAGSVMTKTGGGVVQISGANTGFLGDVLIQSGTVEFQNADSLGVTAKTITVETGGDIATTNAQNRHNIVLNTGGIISANNAAANYTGTVTVNGSATAALRLFQGPGTANSFRIDGSLLGSGTLNVTAPTAATLTLGTTPFAAGAATNNTGFTGRINAGANTTVVINQSLAPSAGLQFSGGTAQLRAANLASPTAGGSGINASYFNMGLDVVASGNPTQFASFQLVEPNRVFNRIDSQINIPNGGGGTHPVVPIPGFQHNVNDAGMWKGLLNVTTAGSYQFNAINDDQAVLFIDGVQIGTIGVNAAGANVGAALNLSAGAHSIVWKFSQGGGGGYTQLRYTGPDTASAQVVVGSVPGSLTTGRLAPVTVSTLEALSGTSTFDTGLDVVAGGLFGTGGATLNLTSGTISDITVTGASSLVGAGAFTLNPNTASITFNDVISGAPGVGLTFNGLYGATFKGANTYDGLTTVSGGRLTLDTTGANSIAGSLTVNAANALGRVRNVVLNQANQIADTAIVTLNAAGILDLGANNETVGTLVVNGANAELIGAGTLTAGTLDLRQGYVSANLASTGGVNKNTAGVITLAGNNTYTGATTISNGAINVRSAGALGAGGAGNDTVVIAGGQLQLQGGVTLGELISLNGNAADGTGALRAVSGVNTLTNPLTLGSSATIQVDGGITTAVGVAGPGSTLTVQGDGVLVVGTDPAVGGVTMVKNGRGALVYGSTLAAFPTVAHNAGVLGFAGTQNFGTITVPAGLSYLFDGSPGAGTTVNVPAGTSLINSGAASNALLGRVGTGSGGFILVQDSANALDFTGKDVSLGARGLVTYSGVITPAAAGYNFTGLQAGIGDGIAPNRLTLGNALTGANTVNVQNGILNLTNLTNTQTGGITVGAGGVVEVLNNPNLGAASNGITLTNGGTLRVSNVSGSAGQIFGFLGNAVNGGSRVVTIGVGGGTIDVPALSGGNNGYSLGGNFSTNLAGDPLDGTGTLTKTGLGFLFINNATDFAGNMAIAANGNQIDIRGNGSWVPATPTTLTVGQAGLLNVDNQNGLGSGRQVPGVYIADRVGDNVGILLEGGSMTYTARNAAGQVTEAFGTVTLGMGQDAINSNVSGQGSIMTFANLVTTPGATLRFGGTANTFGSATLVNNTQLTVTQLNGVALGTTSHIGGFATIFGTNFVGQGATGVLINNGTDQGAAAFTPIAGTGYNLNAAATATLNSAVVGAEDISMLSLRFGNNAAQTLAFTEGGDTLFVTGGGVLTDGNNQARAIGSAVGNGRITAGAIGATGLQQLYLHNNANTLTINATVVDNNGAAPLALVKALDGQVTLAAANPYTGGTYVTRGTLQANVAGSLGSGSVIVKNARLNLNAAGATTGTGTITARDNGEILLNNNTAAFTTGGDKFIIEPNSVILGPNAGNANQGLNSLTRVEGAPAVGGDIQLKPGSIVGHQFNAIGEAGAGINTIKNLGVAADLYFGLSGTFSDPRTTVTIGAGTPWKGISTDRASRTFEEGTILANSDFWLQGQTRDGGLAALSLGSGSSGTYALVNQAGVPINAFVSGQLVLAEDTPVTLPSDLTFVLTNGSLMQPNVTASLGSNANIALNAKVRVLAGATLDPGGFVGVGAAVNQPQGIPYPVASPVNGLVTVEAGGRFLVNDPSGIGSTSPGAWTIRQNGVLDLGNPQAFLGSNGGLINPGQFVFEPGAIARLTNDNRYYKLDQFVNQEPNGQRLVYQIFNSDKSLTEAINPTTIVAPGNATVVPMTLTLSNGGMLTNDASDRTVRERRGKLVLADGAVLAGTTQTYLNVQESIEVLPGATVTIGSTKWVDGQPKLGAVQLTGGASNLINGNVVVSDGAQLAFGAVHVWTDTASLSLPAAATQFPATGATAVQPGNGSILLLNTANYAEVVGPLTGAGAVMANQGGTALAAGFGAASNFTFDGVFKSTNGQNPSLIKVGNTKMSLTNLSDTLGSLTAFQGEVALEGANGKWVGGELRIARGGLMTFDNSVTAIADRQAAGTGNRWITSLGGGEFRLLGHATQVADVSIFGIANGAGAGAFGIPGSNPGGFAKLTVLPDATTTSLTTSLTLGTMERFDNAGEKKTVWLIRGTGVGGLPGTYSELGAYTPNPANPVDGLVYLTDPNFIAANTYDSSGNTAGIIFGAPGTSAVPVRGDLLASASPTATTGEFATIDVALGANRTGIRALTASEYGATAVNNGNLPLNVRVTGAQNYTGDTRIQVAKLENGATLSTSGVLPNLTQPSQIILNAGGILVPAGATATISSTGNNVVRSGGAIAAYVHSFGDLNVTGNFFSDTGFVKTGLGTTTFAAGSLDALRARFTVHEGTVNINDSLANIRNTGVNAISFTGINVALNSGTLNLNGKSQFFNTFESGGILPDAASRGGTLTSATPATVTIQGGGVFSGDISGAITLDKVSNNTLLLTNVNPFTGGLKIQQGTIILRDSATLPNVSTIDLNYGRLDIDDGYLSGINNRLRTDVTLNMRGGDFVNRGRAATLTQQTLGTVNLLQGHNLMQTLSGGNGATETIIGNLVRTAGATVSFQQNYGFTGTAGNDTTSIRYLPTQINGAAVALTNNILPTWMIVNNDHFATYQPGKGISFLGNTEDGFANYDSGDLTTATTLQNVNDGTNRTLTTSKTVNVIRNGGGAQTITLNDAVQLTIGAGGLLTNTNNAVAYSPAASTTGQSITSGTSELNFFIQQNTTSINVPVVGNIAVTKAGSGTLNFTGANTYTGTTYVGQGSNGTSTPTGALNAGSVGANGTSIVAIPGDLQVHNSTVNVTVANSIAQTSNVTLFGGSILNLRDAANTTETLRSITFLNAGGDANSRAIVSRANAQATSALNLTGATPIIADNSNPTSTPTLSTNLGRVNFTGVGPQTLQITSPVTVNGLAAIGLYSNTNIGTVPTGVAEGGLIKSGTGMFVLNGTATDQFGNPATPGTEVFNIQSGYVRVDSQQGLGLANALTTVQNGATLLLNNATGVLGSIRLKDGAFLGASINSSLLGVAPSTGVLDIPAGATTTIGLYDYFVPSTNAANIILNHQLTGSGTINLTGIDYAAGYNGGGVFQLRNETNNFSGTIRIGTNAVMEANTNDADLTGNTFGTASIVLDGGVLRIRDAGNNAAGIQTITYGNNVVLNADSMIDLDRLGTAATQKTIEFGTLTVAAGTRILSTPYGTGASITPNDFRIAFTQVDGAGTLVKGGSRFVDLNGYGVGFSGNIVIAGPQGIATPTSGNLTFNAATNTINNLTVGGFQNFPAGKTVTITSTLDVVNNTGVVANGLNGQLTGGITGSVTISNLASVNAAILRNNGRVSSNNGAATITAPIIRGSGLFHAYGQPLTLDGVVADDGATPTTLKVTGTGSGAAVVLTTPATHTGGTQVQGGTLRVAPTSGNATNPLGTSAVRVIGSPASALGAGTQAVAAINPVLEFAGANILQTGNITNTGTIRVSSGITTLPGVVSGTVPISSNLADFNAATVPGLLEGRYTTTGGQPDTLGNGRDFGAGRPGNPGNFGIQMEPRMGQTNVVTQNPLTGWTDNASFIYTGYFFDADGIFTFMENIDDSTLVSIDGVTRLLNNSGTNPWQTVTSTNSSAGQRGNVADTAVVNTGIPTGLAAIPDNPNLPAGWHSIEIRFDNGGGGGGAVAANGFANNYGFGFNPNGTMALDGTQAFRPIDPGNGTLFRTAAGGKGTIQVDDSSTLNIGSFTQTAALNFNSVAGNFADVFVATGNSSTDAINLTGSAPKGRINVNDGLTVTTGTLNIGAGGNFVVGDGNSGTVVVTGATTFTDAASTVEVFSGTLKLNGPASGGGLVTVDDQATLVVNGALTGSVDVKPGGALKGAGSVVGSLSSNLVFTGADSILAPGDALGTLTFTDNFVDLGAGLHYELQAGAVTVDKVAFTGTASLTLSSWTLELFNLGFQGTSIILFDGEAGQPNLNGGLVGTPTIDYGTTGWSGGTIEFHGGAENDIVLVGLVPEPGSAALLLGGLALLAGGRRVRRRA